MPPLSRAHRSPVLTALLLIPLLAALTLLSAALVLDRGLGPLPEGARYDAIIVAGCRVGPDGQPSLALRRRVDHALQLYAEGRAPRVIFTGGVGSFPPSEAEAAATYALERGLPPTAVVLEANSTSTEENAARSADLLAAEGLPHARVLVVTDAYHTFRARRVFARHYAHVDAAGSRPRFVVRVRGALREVFAVAGYLVMGRL